MRGRSWPSTSVEPAQNPAQRAVEDREVIDTAGDAELSECSARGYQQLPTGAISTCYRGPMTAKRWANTSRPAQNPAHYCVLCQRAIAGDLLLCLRRCFRLRLLFPPAGFGPHVPKCDPLFRGFGCLAVLATLPSNLGVPLPGGLGAHLIQLYRCWAVEHEGMGIILGKIILDMRNSSAYN